MLGVSKINFAGKYWLAGIIVIEEISKTDAKNSKLATRVRRQRRQVSEHISSVSRAEHTAQSSRAAVTEFYVLMHE